MSDVADRLRKLADEHEEWLRDNTAGMFNICCQRCNAPFEHEGQAVAAPAEWYGLLSESRANLDYLRGYADALDALAKIERMSASASPPQPIGQRARDALAAAARLFPEDEA